MCFIFVSNAVSYTIFMYICLGFAGTPGYLSPEVLKKEPYGKPVDIWACGKCPHLDRNINIREAY
jgi:serine/threonine protein kinase